MLSKGKCPARIEGREGVLKENYRRGGICSGKAFDFSDDFSAEYSEIRTVVGVS